MRAIVSEFINLDNDQPSNEDRRRDTVKTSVHECAVAFLGRGVGGL
jgi:hypothetical protein